MPIKPSTLEELLQSAGFCCEWGFCALTQPKKARGNPRCRAGRFAARLDCSIRSIYRARSRFDKGESCCKGLETCQKKQASDTDPADLVFHYPATFRLAYLDGADQWLITFRDFPEVKRYCHFSGPKEDAAMLGLEEAISARIRLSQNVPFPSRAWEGDRLVATPIEIAERLMKYRKFWLKKEKPKDSM